MPKVLTEQQVEQYHRDGFVSPIRIMSEDDANALRREIEAFEASQGKPIHGTQKTKAFLRFPWAYDLVTMSTVLDAVEDVLGPDILCYQHGLWFKEPESGSYVSWHQDSTYYGMDPWELLSAWVALTPVNEVTGCIQVLPGTHKEGCFPVEYTERKDENLLASGQRTTFDFDPTDAVSMHLEPGEMSMHHVCLVHSSKPNLSDDRRMGLSAGYLPPYVKQTTELKATAMLVRGKDEFGYYLPNELPPVAHDDPETIARQEKSVELYRAKSIECGNQTAWRLG
ncbi:MAG: phytanoyl-CoA dioxygenase [Rhodospirillaceae bacterium]|nr:phytanoyl-CoA dioxygenase [Rhodospirillaceae bacterium]|tara:strand:+ start:23289 stop:24134 length:846 start_codon:yes stop_codon:yes gene_type:complete